MKKITANERKTRFAAITIAAILPMSTIGCGNSNGSHTAPASAVTASLHGSALGGLQPIQGATMYLYAAGTSGYASSATNVLTSLVQTDASGMFDITGKYNCTAGQQMYIMSVGGNPGAGVNPQAVLGAALGDCSTLTASTYININEATTIGLAFGLAPFATGYANIGSTSTNAVGLKQAFASSQKLVDTTSGQAGVNIPQGAQIPVSEIYALANVIASCVSSTGGTSGDGSSCGTLFSLATPSGGTTPTDTFGLALAIAQNPTLNVAAIYNRIPTQNPYAPYLSSAPADWTVSVIYPVGGFNAPKSTTVDANGNIYVANSGNNTVTVLASSGAVTKQLSGNGLNAPAAVAIDPSGNAWVANQGGGTISAFTSGGSALGGSPFAVGTAPGELAFDASGNAWVANATSSSVSELSSTGTLLNTYTSGIATPVAIVIDSH